MPHSGNHAVLSGQARRKVNVVPPHPAQAAGPPDLLPKPQVGAVNHGLVGTRVRDGRQVGVDCLKIEDVTVFPICYQ